MNTQQDAKQEEKLHRDALLAIVLNLVALVAGGLAITAVDQVPTKFAGVVVILFLLTLCDALLIPAFSVGSLPRRWKIDWAIALFLVVLAAVLGFIVSRKEGINDSSLNSANFIVTLGLGMVLSVFTVFHALGHLTTGTTSEKLRLFVGCVVLAVSLVPLFFGFSSYAQLRDIPSGGTITPEPPTSPTIPSPTPVPATPDPTQPPATPTEVPIPGQQTVMVAFTTVELTRPRALGAGDTEGFGSVTVYLDVNGQQGNETSQPALFPEPQTIRYSINRSFTVTLADTDTLNIRIEVVTTNGGRALLSQAYTGIGEWSNAPAACASGPGFSEAGTFNAKVCYQLSSPSR